MPNVVTRIRTRNPRDSQRVHPACAARRTPMANGGRVSGGRTPKRGKGSVSMTRCVGSYRIGRLLGEGAAGRVHLATAPDGARVAVKLLRPSLFARRDSERRWLEEARIGARIEHENVVHVLDAGVDTRSG